MHKEFLYSILTGFLVSVILTPVAVKISKKKGFLATPNHRSSHFEQVPNSGGIILIVAILIPLFLFSNYFQSQDFSLLLSALMVLLITGVIDDFNPIPVFYKFIGQFIPAIVIVSSFSSSDLTIPFIGVLFDVPQVFNHIFWIVAIVTIMNAYNLIDGIDGLAIGLGIFSSMAFCWFFIKTHAPDLAVFSLALCGGLSGLLIYNLSHKGKIFIGDTGSLLIGGILGYFTLKLLNINDYAYLNRSAFIMMGILFIPVFDMLRVIGFRIVRRQSPFAADRNHVHHIMLDNYKLKHYQVSAILVTFQTLIFITFYKISTYLHEGYLLIVLLVFVAYLCVLLNLVRKKKNLPSYMLLLFGGFALLLFFL